MKVHNFSCRLTGLRSDQSQFKSVKTITLTKREVKELCPKPATTRTRTPSPGRDFEEDEFSGDDMEPKIEAKYGENEEDDDEDVGSGVIPNKKSYSSEEMEDEGSEKPRALNQEHTKEREPKETRMDDKETTSSDKDGDWHDLDKEWETFTNEWSNTQKDYGSEEYIDVYVV